MKPIDDIDPWNLVKAEAFRFEGLPRYSSNEFDSRFREYTDSGHVRHNDSTEWSREVASMRANGIAINRLRATSEPLSMYERYELEVGYRPGILAGENIRKCNRVDVPKTNDFWLFDNRYIQFLDYDDAGALIQTRLYDADSHRLIIEEIRKVYEDAQPVRISYET